MRRCGMSIEQTITRVRAFRAFKSWTVSRFAAEAGIGESAIRKMDDPDWNPEAKTLKRLEAVIPAAFKGDGSDEPEQPSDAKVA